MTTKKDIAIKKVMADFEELSNMVLSQLDLLENFFQTGDIEVPETTLKTIEATENKIDALELKINERIINTIALYQPMASDIRKLMSSYRIINSLERIGDHVLKLLIFMKKVKNKEVYSEFSDLISAMFLSSSQMVNNALLSFTQNDRELAIWTIRNDTIAHEMNKKMLKKAINKSKNFDDKKNILLSFITIKEMVDNIERIADHSTNIAEASFYFIEGKDIRHQNLDLD